MARTTEFGMIPEASDLEQIERVLQFFPATVDALQTWSTQQVARFNRARFLKSIRFFDGSDPSGHWTKPQ